MFQDLLCLTREALPEAKLFVLAPEEPPKGDHKWIRDGGVSLNRAIFSAMNALPEQPVMILPADLPIVSSKTLKSLAELALEHDVVIAPDRHSLGTNALCMSRTHLINTVFGRDSFEQHRLASKAIGIEPHVFRSNDIALDLDTPDDLALCQKQRELPKYA